MTINPYSKKFLLFSGVILISLIIIGLSNHNPETTILISVIALLSLANAWLIYLLVLPTRYGKTRLRRITVTITISVFTIAYSLIKKNEPKIQQIVKNLWADKLPIKPYIHSSHYILLLLLLGSGIILFIINYWVQDKSVMKEHHQSFKENFPERDFLQRLRSFCTFLQNQLENLDTEANWSNSHFTPLDAEVEMLKLNKKKRKISNLLSAIKTDRRSKVFLILGEPGSGKSVALRKLCRDLLNETIKKRKIPIYLNLKEWYSDRVWTEFSPPTQADLTSFFYNSLKGKDIFADEFIEKYFKTLYENGHLFFIIDSFDEVPAILDVDESDKLIDQLSEILYNFLGGAHESRGILASRYFRKPTSKFRADSILNIRPFSDKKIFESLSKYIAINTEKITELFVSRIDLLPIASNPFSVGLLYSYMKDNNNNLPGTQAEMYESYIRNRIDSAKKVIQKKQLSVTTIFDFASDISSFMMYSQSLGLEIPLHSLRKNFTDYEVEDIIEILVYSRLGRIGKGEESRFSFVHRRFNEYFVIQKFLKNPDLINLESIPLDLKYRDALILYCEVAPDEMAKKIAIFCWHEIIQIRKKDHYKRAIHSLRFIIEAFAMRQTAINSFRKGLGNLVSRTVKNHQKNKHALTSKVAAEAIGIIDFSNMERSLVSCFNINNPWINQTAIRSCRYFKTLSSKIEEKLISCLIGLSFQDILTSKEDILFSLSLSQSFKKVRFIFKIKILDVYLFYTSIFVFLLIDPLIALMIFSVFLSFYLILINAATLGNKVFSKNKHNGGRNIAEMIDRLRFATTFPIVVLYLKILSPVSILVIPTFISKNRILHTTLLIFVLIAYSSLLNMLSLLFTRPQFTRSNIILFLKTSVIAYIQTIKFLIKRTRFSIKNIRIILRDILRAILISGLLIALIGSTIYLMSTTKTGSIITISLISIAILFVSISSLIALRKDLLLLKKLRPVDRLSRADIAQYLQTFTYESSKYNFVSMLDKNLQSIEGDWPEHFDLISNSKSIVLLAQLDEIWLGLN